MKALLVVAHGSRKKESNAEVLGLVRELNQKARGAFDVVRGAFIQFTTPLVPEVIAELVESGVKEATVLPYFIAGGSHVTNDIPELIAEARRAYPELIFKVTSHLGKFEGLADYILDRVSIL